ncbi:MAG: hypothetical protein LAO51_15705 [Acidobacteriia bacterium]|nr:hypothetical protein [Terriglobia bacterium]
MIRAPGSSTSRRRVGALLLVVLAALATACRSDIVVRVWTRIYDDASVSRRLEVSGRRADESKPAKKDWLEEEAGIHLARPEAWARHDADTGRLSAEGTFPSAADVPPCLAFETDAGRVPDSAKPAVTVENLVVLKHWVYTETYADPFGAAAVSSALDHLVGMAADALRDELKHQLGDRFDTAPAEKFVRTEVRSLAGELFDARSRNPGDARAAARESAWAAILARHGIAAAPAGEKGFFKAQQAGLFEWTRRRVAEALSRPDAPMSPADLAFWPTGDGWEQRSEEIVERVYGSDDELLESIRPSLRALTGYYGDLGSPRFRFEPALEMPGRLLATNGTASREGVVWFLRDEDLGAAGRTLEAESVTLDDEKLRALGARREFEPGQLLQLTDILSRRDPDGALRKILATAVEKGRLSILREKDAVPSELELLVRELADVLDPAVQEPAAR